MINLLKRFKELIIDERGAMPIFEATFVFPIMFFVIFFLIFMGNMYFSKAYTDNLVTEAAIRTAAKCADPNLNSIISSGKVSSSVGSIKNEPYRYIFNAFGSGSGSIASAKSQGKNYIVNDLGSFNSFFKKMEPQLDTSSVRVDFKNNVISYDLAVTAKYKISLPWKFIFSDDINIYEFTSRAEVPISDAPEFIRNIDMFIDYMQQSKNLSEAKESLSKLFNKSKIKDLKL